jgi:hypothetical protein
VRRGAIQDTILASGISVLLNCFVIIMSAVMSPVDLAYSTFGRIVTSLGRPGGVFVEWFMPGHDLRQVVMVIVSSLIFYWFVVWVGLTLLRRLGPRLG